MVDDYEILLLVIRSRRRSRSPIPIFHPFPFNFLTLQVNPREMDGLKARSPDVSFESGYRDRVFSGFGEVDPADWEFLIDVRCALLVLDMLPAFDINAPNETAFPGVGQADPVIAGNGDIHFP